MSFDQPDYSKQEKQVQRQMDEQIQQQNADLEAKKMALYSKRLEIIKSESAPGYSESSYKPASIPKSPSVPSAPKKRKEQPGGRNADHRQVSSFNRSVMPSSEI